jgi:hypothetical protein
MQTDASAAKLVPPLVTTDHVCELYHAARLPVFVSVIVIGPESNVEPTPVVGLSATAHDVQLPLPSYAAQPPELPDEVMSSVPALIDWTLCVPV